MIAAERTACLLLAAGRSRRFGADDKLMAPLQGRPVAAHAASMLAGLPFARHIAVVADLMSPLTVMLRAHGFDTAAGEASASGMGGSIALGMSHVAGVDALLLCLADMPFVPAGHIVALLAAAGRADERVASVDAHGQIQPPAVFGRSHFGALAKLNGDKGARDLLGAARPVRAPFGSLRDVDRPEDLTP